MSVVSRIHELPTGDGRFAHNSSDFVRRQMPAAGATFLNALLSVRGLPRREKARLTLHIRGVGGVCAQNGNENRAVAGLYSSDLQRVAGGEWTYPKIGLPRNMSGYDFAFHVFYLVCIATQKDAYRREPSIAPHLRGEKLSPIVPGTSERFPTESYSLISRSE